MHPIYCDIFCPAKREQYMACRLTSDISTKEFHPVGILMISLDKPQEAKAAPGNVQASMIFVRSPGKISILFIKEAHICFCTGRIGMGGSS